MARPFATNETRATHIAAINSVMPGRSAAHIAYYL